ncbi:MAG: DUF4760 domain-containing protein [Pyrinomonadaceae bacterium]
MKQESAELILKLYELRREEVLRKAREWFMSFNPESAEELRQATFGEHSAYLRMVTGYWDMAASFVNHGVIDEEMFADATGEHVVVFAKVEPFLEEFRKMIDSPQLLQHLEKLVRRMPGSTERLPKLRERFRETAKQRAAAATQNR